MIYIVSHTHCDLPRLSGYQPLYVGAAGLPQAQRRADWRYDDGFPGSISQKNDTYCELTGLKWIAERGEGDVVGLVHYRRFFQSPKDPARPLSFEEAEGLLGGCECIVAAKTTCIVFDTVVSLAQHYRQNHCSTDLIQMMQVIGQHFPDYVTAAQDVLAGTGFYPFNMVVCRKGLLERYAAWLFSVLERLSERIDPTQHRDDYQRRAFGFISERLFSVWLLKNEVRLCELPVTSLVPDKEPFTGEGAADAPFVLPTGPFEAQGFTPMHNGLDYSPVFDVEFYRNHNGDVASACHDDAQALFEHYLNFGIDDGRQAHRFFSIESYRNGNPALRARFSDDKRALLEYHLRKPNKGTHFIGYENLFVERGPRALPSREERRRARYQAEAEAQGVID